jgi:hypothetical protein
MSFHVSAESEVRPVCDTRQTREAAIGLALNYIDQGFSAVGVRDAGTGASYGEEFLLAYSPISGLAPTRPLNTFQP